jgi:CheY-like chemotaxis protein
VAGSGYNWSEPWAVGYDALPMSIAERLAGVSILVVEDDLDGREMLEQFLSYVGASVRTAASAEEGFELFKAAPPAIVVTDIGMPSRDGLWLLQRIRALPAVPRVPVVALTGYCRTDEREMLRAAGFDAQAVKPLDLDHVVEVIAAVTGR